MVEAVEVEPEEEEEEGLMLYHDWRPQICSEHIFYSGTRQILDCLPTCGEEQEGELELT